MQTHQAEPTQETPDQHPLETTHLGGPGSNTDPFNVNTPEENPVPAPQQVPQSNIFRDFKTVEEVISYAQRLESKLLDQPTDTRRVDPQPSIQEPVAKRPSDLLWEDPDKAFDMAVNTAVERAISTIQKRDTVKETQQRFWEDFYTTNPDLKGFEDDVTMIMNNFGREFAPMKPQEGMKALADKVRSKHKAVLDRYNKGTPLPNSGGVTMPASTTTTQRKEPEYQVVSFADQVTNLRKRGALVASKS